MDKRLVSIILPVYNGAAYLSEAIESILNQSHTEFELIIVDDCSTDDSAVIAENYKNKDTRIKIIHNPENKKLPASLNIGHKAAKGNYITWTSHDNILKSDFLKTLLNSIKEKGVGVVFSNYDIINEKGKIIREHVSGPSNGLLFGNLIGASFLYTKEIYLKLNGYNENLFLVEDYDFWLRASQICPFHHIGDNLYAYRLQEASLTNTINLDNKTTVLHQKALTKMFFDIGKLNKWHAKTLEVILAHHFSKSYNLSNYFKYRKTIKKDLQSFAILQADSKSNLLGLYLFLRNQIKLYKKNQTFLSLINLIRYEPKVICHPTYSKKETLKLIRKGIF